jgi:vancomycin resistance protein YoaR
MQNKSSNLFIDGTRPMTATTRTIIVLVVFFLMLGGILLGTSIGLHMLYNQRVLPGVSFQGTPLGGKTLIETEQLLEQTFAYPEQGRIVLKAAGLNWVVKPADLGLHINTNKTAQAAYQIGRGRSLFDWLFTPVKSLVFGQPISPILVFEESIAEQYLTNHALMIDRPTLEARLGINGTTVELVTGQVGMKLDVASALNSLNIELMTLHDFSMALPVIETPPLILDAREQAVIAQKILFAPLTLMMPEGQRDVGPWVITVEKLAQMLVITRGEDSSQTGYRVGLDQVKISNYLEELESSINQDVQNARFIFNDDTRKLDLNQSAVVGRRLDVDTSLAGINQGLLDGQHTIQLAIITDQPAVLDDSTADQLGIHELIWAETSYFRGSSTERIQNITAAAARFHGSLVPPGATFSMSDALGDISLDNGYAEALIIYGDQTIKGIGGGVCQVSTTLFRTAFHAGFPVIERHAHAYRVSYYEQRSGGGTDSNLAGLDATVFVPIVDLKFTNDTPYWLLMETYVRASSITWKFYSTSDGRTVEWETSGPTNVIEPPGPLYRENQDLEKGEINQVDWEAEGADITVIRSVYRNGGLYFQDTFKTHYLPWRAIFEYGPGTENIPTPEP